MTDKLKVTLILITVRIFHFEKSLHRTKMKDTRRVRLEICFNLRSVLLDF